MLLRGLQIRAAGSSSIFDLRVPQAATKHKVVGGRLEENSGTDRIPCMSLSWPGIMMLIVAVMKIRR